MGKLISNEEFIKKASLIHNNFFNYDKTNYVNSRTHIIISCPIHGDFKARPDCHLGGGKCKKCSNEKKSFTNEEFLQKLKNKFGDLYNLSKVNYINSECNVELICQIHGSFIRNAGKLLHSNGCQKCNKEKADNNQRKSIDKLLIDFKKTHGDRYDYSLVDGTYINTYTPVEIICKIHGIFKQIPRDHIHGNNCPKCNESKGEQFIENFLITNNIIFEKQKIFNECKYKQHLKFDFYIPIYNICIEYDGKQHYHLNEYFGGEKEFKKIKDRDNIKNNYCKENNIILYRIRYDSNILNDLSNIIKTL